MDQSCRTFIERLDVAGEVVDVPGRVDLEYELGAIVGLWDSGPVVRVSDPGGFGFPVFANVLNSRERIASAVGSSVADLSTRVARAVRSFTAPVLGEDAPCQAVRRLPHEGELLSLLPIPRFFERDSGPYLTAGMICAYEPTTGYRNASYARIKPLGNNRAFIGIAPNHHLAALARIAAQQGATLDIAIVLGAHPAIQLAACFYLGLGDDELGHAADLLGEPVRTVSAITSQVLVPADAELVIEARLDPGSTVAEGWVSEYHGMYEDYGHGFELEITALTHRQDAWFQVILPGLFSEHVLLGALPIGAGLVQALRSARIDVADLALRRCGGGRVDVVVAVRDLAFGAARRAFFTAWSAVSMVKQVTLVDPDIDVWDDEQVDWARTARMRWDTDVLIVPDVITDRNEPMQSGGVVAKVGFDATVKPGRRRTGWERALPPASVVKAAAERIGALSGSHLLAPGLGLPAMVRREE